MFNNHFAALRNEPKAVHVKFLPTSAPNATRAVGRFQTVEQCANTSSIALSLLHTSIS